jgi:hypothetical protein
MKRLLLFLLGAVSFPALAEAAFHCHNSGFESLPEGPCASSGTGGGWEVKKTGREAIHQQLQIR